MRTTTAVTLAALTAGSAMAQVSPISIGKSLVGLLSPSCQAAVGQLLNSTSPQYQCLQIDALLPAILANGSIIPPIDAYLSDVCYSTPCNSTVLNQTIAAVTSECSTDLAEFGVTNATVSEIISLYPLALEVACLKTTNATAPANASIPLNSTSYNTTNGTFCLTELATDLSGYLGVNLTNSYIDTLALGGNATGLMSIEMIPPTALCSDCIFAAVDLIEGTFPQLGDIVVSQTTNTTVNGYLNSTCAAVGYNVTTNGTLPTTIDNPAVDQGFVNSTTFNSTMFNTTSIGNSSTSTNLTSAALPSEAATILSSAQSAATSSAALSGRMAEKKRWFGGN